MRRVVRSDRERRLAVLVEPLERAILDGVREFETEPDRIRVELGLVPVFLDERPLLGLAGYIDWRTSGRLSAVLRSGFFTGAVGEQLLMPGERRIPVDRLVLVGAGGRAEFDEARARELAVRCMEIATGLSAATVLFALPLVTDAAISRELVEIGFEALLEQIERPSDTLSEDASGERGASDAEPSPVEGEEIDAERPDDDPADPSNPALESQQVSMIRGPETSEAGVSEAAVSEAGDSEAGRVAQEPIDPQSGAGEASRHAAPRWWVVADEAVVVRLRRVRSGPPRAARGGPNLYT
jgi:hypothetical protein